MPNNIKPSEVSEVLLQQLRDADTGIKFEEVGVVLTIGDGCSTCLRPYPCDGERAGRI